VQRSNKVEYSSRKYYKEDYSYTPSIIMNLIRPPTSLHTPSILPKAQESYERVEKYVRELRGVGGMPRTEKGKVELKKMRVGSSGGVRPRNWWG
jgi:hypothetical protein